MHTGFPPRRFAGTVNPERAVTVDNLHLIVHQPNGMRERRIRNANLADVGNLAESLAAARPPEQAAECRLDQGP
jgi:hypothetical protein